MILQTLEYHCDAKECSAVHAESHRVDFGDTIRSYLPQGWTGLMGGGLYCPAHSAKMLKAADE